MDTMPRTFRPAERFDPRRWLPGLLVGLILLAPGVAAFSASPLQPVRLRCEGLDEAIGVGRANPRLGWVLEGDGRGRRQTAYRILAASDPARLKVDQGDGWDTERVTSAEQTFIAYAGRELRSNEEVFWKVRVWDEAGREGPWSAVGRWRVALLGPDDWRAEWITTGETNALPLPLFRKAFSLAKPARRALVHVTGLGHYDLLLDGRKVGDRFLDPAWSRVERTVYYATFEIPQGLKAGPHVLGVMLGKGFHHTAGDRRVHGVRSSGPLILRLQAHLWDTDGHESVVTSDASWRWSPGPITHSAILGGEDYDARRLPQGWGEAGFDDASWRHVVQTAGPGGVLTPTLAPPMKVQETFAPIRIDEPEPGVFVYDFGQNASAIPRLRIRGQPGQTVKLTPAEQRHGMTPRRNDGQGKVNPAGVGTPNYFQYTLRGGEAESWSPQFTYSGFQYLQVEGAVPRGRKNPEDRPVLEELVSVHVRNDAPEVGSFECSSPLFNGIDRIIDRAVRANLAHVLTDCPHREKLGWLEVAYLMGPSIAGRFDVGRFYAKIARDCREAQRPDGQVPTVAPAYPRFEGGFDYTPEWGAAAVVVPWLLYEWYGDRRTLAEAYPTMRGFVDYLEATSKGLVPKPGLGDWYDYGHGKPVGASQFTPPELTAMATFHRCARIVADTAAALGHPDDRERYGALASRIAAAFNERWFDGAAEYRNLGSPQTAHGMALALGLVPPGRESAVLERLVADLRRRGNQQTSGDVGHAYLLRALAEHGRSDVIQDLVVRTNLGSYGFIVNNGWTSMPEAWDADTGASMDHCMLGHIQEWFLGHVAGIRPDPEAPGFARFLLAPEPVGDLAWARGRYDSVRGRVEGEWRREGQRFRLQVRVPVNTTARLWIPAESTETLLENGRALDRVRGIQWVGFMGGRAELEVGSGTFRLESRLPQPRVGK